MTTEILEKLVAELKTNLDAYTATKNFGSRKIVRKTLQAIKVAAQEMRVWILEDSKK